MIVLSDTSPICYLLLIGQIDLLPRLFQSITIPVAVRNELLNENAGDSIHTWIQNPSTWLNIQTVPQPLLPLPDYLDAGEREAISLAVLLQADLVIIDDLDARTAAQQLNLPLIGTLGILYRANRCNFGCNLCSHTQDGLRLIFIECFIKIARGHVQFNLPSFHFSNFAIRWTLRKHN